MQRTSAMSTHRRRLTAKTRWFSTCNQTIRDVVYTGNIHTDVLTHICRHPQFIMCLTLVMFTNIHNSSCSHTGHVYRHPQLIMCHAPVMSTDIHNSSCSRTGHVYRHPQFMFTCWSCLQTSTVHHVHIHRHPEFITLTQWSCINIHNSHNGHVYTHPQFIMFT